LAAGLALLLSGAFAAVLSLTEALQTHLHAR